MTDGLRPRRLPGWEFWLTLALLAVTLHMAADYPPPPTRTSPPMLWLLLGNLVVLPLLLQLGQMKFIESMADLARRQELSLTLLDPRCFLVGRFGIRFRSCALLLAPPLCQALIMAAKERDSDASIVLWLFLALGMSALAIAQLGMVLRLWFACTRGSSNSGMGVYTQWLALLAGYLQVPAVIYVATKLDIPTSLALLDSILTIGILIWLVLIRRIIIRTAEVYFQFED